MRVALRWSVESLSELVPVLVVVSAARWVRAPLPVPEVPQVSQAPGPVGQKPRAALREQLAAVPVARARLETPNSWVGQLRTAVPRAAVTHLR